MRIMGSALFLLCSFAFTSNLSAQENKSLSALPAEGFRFTGTWDCEGTIRNTQLHKATFTGATILGGKWLELTEQDVQPATGYLAKYLIGYDSQQKHLVEFDANNFGAWTYVSEDGWQNNVVNLSSAISLDPQAPYADYRFLYSISGRDHIYRGLADQQDRRTQLGADRSSRL